MSIPKVNLTGLSTYLKSVIPGIGDLEEIEKFFGGQSNPTFRLRTSADQYVLRRKPEGALLKSAHAVDREFRVLNALQALDVPVPRVFHLCEDDTVIGSMFYVMEFVDGRVFWDPALPDQSPEDRGAIYDEMNRVLAAIHSVDLATADLEDFGSTGNYYERQFKRWSAQYRASETELIPDMEALLSWLEANMMPDDGRVALTHGDYRIDNIMFAQDAPHAVAVMDWELSTLGHPFADLAYQCMLWRWPGHPALQGLGNRDLAALGIPNEEAYVEAYCERTGLGGIGNWNFYVAFGAFRLAAIAQGVRKRALDSNASSDKAMLVGSLAPSLASLGLNAAETP